MIQIGQQKQSEAFSAGLRETDTIAREKSRKFKRKMALFSVNVKQVAFL